MAANTRRHASHHALKDDLRQRLHSIGENIVGAADDVKSAAVKRFSQARHTAGEYLEEGRQRAEELEQGLEKKVSHHPFVSMCLATGLGFLLGLVFWRR